MSCVEVVYTSTITNAAAAISGTNLIVTANVGSGLIVVKYLPTNSLGNYGNVTYVFVYFSSGGCTPPDPCNMVQNGGFENVLSGAPYGDLNTIASGGPILNCWECYTGSQDLYYSGATGVYQLGVNTVNTIPPVSSFNGSPNGKIVGNFCLPGAPNSETLKNNLSAPLIPGQSYKVSFMSFNYSGNLANTAGSSIINPNFDPIVITVASNPVFAFIPPGNFPSGLNILSEFTITPCNVWVAVTQTFVFSPSLAVNNNAIIIGPNPANMNSILNSPLILNFIDDLSIVPLPAPTFILPPAIPCGNATFTNLAQYTSTVSPGTFTGTGVTFTNNMYHFNSPPTLTTGNYPVGFTYTNSQGCVNTIYQNVNVVTSLSLTNPGTLSYCNNGSNIVTLVMTPNPPMAGVNYTWQPGNLSGYTPTVNPLANTLYTANVTVGNCTATNTLSVTVNFSCCPSSTIPTFTSSITGSTVFSTPFIFLNSFAVTPTQTLTLSGSEFLFASGVKLTVAASAVLEIKDAHLYSCNADLWQGIEVLSGGRVKCSAVSYDNLIEDAVTAIDIKHNTLGASLNILDVTNTTFNKNLIGISIVSYTQAVYPYPFKISNCIFTCRDLPYTPTGWPQTGTLSAATGTAADLRYTGVTLADALAAPYLTQSGFTITTLKQPYSLYTSQKGIAINNVGYNLASQLGITIGDDGTPGNFNLFDAQNIGIEAQNSNLNSYNNVFQNSQLQSYYHYEYDYNFYTGYGIRASNNYGNSLVISSKLNLTPSTNLLCINRFYNCHNAVRAVNQGKLDIRYARFSSSQSSTATPGPTMPGAAGINVLSNRFEDYKISDCYFFNLNTGILSETQPDYVATSQFGHLWGTYSVSTNYFSPVTNTANALGTNYMGMGINFVQPICGYMMSTSSPGFYTVTPYEGIKVKYNSLHKVQNGIAVSSFINFGLGIGIGTNEILLAPATSTNIPQYGINAAYNNSCSVNTNTVVATTTNALQNVVGIYGSFLGGSGIRCNVVSTLPRGFEFAGQFNNFLWTNNTMHNNARGMQATNWGSSAAATGFGPQGSPSMASDNYWAGSWNGPPFQTWVDANSNVQNAKLYVRPVSGYALAPTSNSFAVGVQPNNTYASSLNFSTTTTPSTLNCVGFSAFAINPGTDLDYLLQKDDADPSLEIMRFLLFLQLNRDSVMLYSDNDFLDFYFDNKDNELGMLVELENNFAVGDYTEAQNLLEDFSPETNIQENFKSFYDLYYSYRTNATMSEAEKGVLEILCYQCPFSDGPAVYKARALWTLIYGGMPSYYDDECTPEGYSSRIGKTENTSDLDNLTQLLAARETKNIKRRNKNEYNIYPNPATNEISITGFQKDESVEVIISEVTGRELSRQIANLDDSVINLKVELNNGIYFVTLVNSKTEKVVKKLIISK